MSENITALMTVRLNGPRLWQHNLSTIWMTTAPVLFSMPSDRTDDFQGHPK
ncbi:MAG: hypothetical protein P8Y03_28400 [Anaerolineales bacterium]|jgi:hypothetical protein